RRDGPDGGGGRRSVVRSGGTAGVRDAHGVGVDDSAAASDRVQSRRAAGRTHGARRNRRCAQRRQASRGARERDLNFVIQTYYTQSPLRVGIFALRVGRARRSQIKGKRKGAAPTALETE